MQARFLKAGWLWLLAIILLGYGMHAQTRVVQAQALQSGGQRYASISASKPDFSRFARSWIAHSAVLNFSANGLAVFEARVYTWCGQGVKLPCDTIDAAGHIYPGYWERIQFSRASATVAYGTIIAGDFHPVGTSVTASLQENDTLLYAGQNIIALLCGPDAPVGACGA
jgi:hypothetical protein